MNKFLANIVSFLIFLFFTGCGSESVQNQITQIKTTAVNYIAPQKIEPPKDTRPKWVNNPDFGGNVGVVSIVSKEKIKDRAKLEYIAKMKAQAEFETRKGTNVDSSTKVKTNNDGEMNMEENIKISSSSIQTAKLEVEDTYEDEDNFYLWMVKR
jgi:hypothetical protein